MTRDSGRTLFSALACWVVLPVLSAGLLVLAYPPFDFPLLAWVALVPLFLLLYRCSTLSGFGLGLLTGVVFYLLLMAWTAELFGSTPWNFWVLAVVFGCFFSLFGGISSWLLFRLPGSAPLLLPCLWVAIEYLRCHIGFLSQPFGILGYSQYTLQPVAGIASFSGVYGVSFLVIAGNSVLTALILYCFCKTGRNGLRSVINHRPRLFFICTIAVLLGWFVYYAIQDKNLSPSKKLTVAVVQGNAQADAEFGYQHYLDDVLPLYEDLTRAASGATLVVWPSSSVPGILPGDRSMVQRLGKLAKETKTFLLIGSAGFDKFNPEQMRKQRIANSAFLFAPNGRILDRYDKIKLLPFDEYLPARSVISWPSWLVPEGMTDHYPGQKLTMFNAGLARFGVQICFENMFPEQTRQLARNGAHFLVGQTNEAYTDSLAGHYQNLGYYVFRAIENRMPVIRTATTGISCIIDAMGRIISSVQDNSGREVGITGMAVAQIDISGERSFYTRHGDLFAYLCLVLSFIGLSFASFVKIRGLFF